MKNAIINSLLVLGSIVLSVGTLELVARIYKSEYRSGNFLDAKRDLFRAAYPTEFDVQLGWVPKPGEHPENIWQTELTILEDGIRSNGRTPPAPGSPVILAVGDSFTFGDQVANQATWPSLLESLRPSRVLNGGVFGYGVDQIYLRMLMLAAKYHPDRIIFSLIQEDIRRSELWLRTSVPKPYFEIADDGALRLKDEHVVYHPPPPLSAARKLLGYSFLVHKLAMRAFPEFWLQGSWQDTPIHRQGREVVCLIFQALAGFSLTNDVPITLLVQYQQEWPEQNLDTQESVLGCVDREVLQIVDLRDTLARIRNRDPDQHEKLFSGHMTAAGNRVVANLLHQELEQTSARRRAKPAL